MGKVKKEMNEEIIILPQDVIEALNLKDGQRIEAKQVYIVKVDPFD